MIFHPMAILVPLFGFTRGLGSNGTQNPSRQLQQAHFPDQYRTPQRLKKRAWQLFGVRILNKMTESARFL